MFGLRRHEGAARKRRLSSFLLVLNADLTEHSKQFEDDQPGIHGCLQQLRSVDPKTGMGLELTPSESDQEGALHLLIQLLVASGKAARLETLVHQSSSAPQLTQNPHRQSHFAPDDCLLALILNPDSLNREEFLTELRRQRSQSLNK